MIHPYDLGPLFNLRKIAIQCIIVLTIMHSWSLKVSAQSGSFMDPRDSIEYKTISVAGTTWMIENLKFRTETSYCKNEKELKGPCKAGNFYALNDIRTACPSSWEIPEVEDWDQAMRYYYKENEYAKLLEDNPKKFRMDLLVKDKGLFHSDHMMGILPLGRIQGGQLVSGHFVDFWTINSKTNDEKFHMHFTNLTMTGHAHKHNIIDKTNKIRMFAIRCIQSSIADQDD